MEKNEIFLDFRICDFNDITHEQISKIIELEPTFILKKGTKKYPDNTESTVTFKENVWIYRIDISGENSFEIQLTSLLNIIEPRINLLKPLCEKYYSEFSCAVFINNNEESTPSIFLDRNYNTIIKELNSEFDLDLYF